MRLVRAEFLKVRRRRGLVVAAALLTVVPVALAFAVTAVLHASDPARYDPVGGVDDLDGAIGLLTQIGIVAAILIGATAGAGDVGAGVFRELVATGRSRIQLYAARLPGGLALLLPLVGVAFAVAATASVVLAGSDPAPGAGLLLKYAAWVAVATTTAYVLAVVAASLLGSRGTTFGVLLAWQLAAAPLLLATGKLDAFLPIAALERLSPAAHPAAVSTSAAAAVAALAAWTLVPLAAGAWRTATRDA